MVWILDLLFTCKHHSELRVITAPLLISTIHRSPQHPLSLSTACCVFNSRSLATASNNGDSSASCAHVDTVRLISSNWTLSQLSTELPQTPLQSSTQLPILNWLLTTDPRQAAISNQSSLLFTGWLSTENWTGQSQVLLHDWRFTANQFVLATSPLRITTSNFIFQLTTCGYSPYVTCSLTRGCSTW
jgi:hypothetical protein